METIQRMRSSHFTSAAAEGSGKKSGNSGNSSSSSSTEKSTTNKKSGATKKTSSQNNALATTTPNRMTLQAINISANNLQTSVPLHIIATNMPPSSSSSLKKTMLLPSTITTQKRTQASSSQTKQKAQNRLWFESPRLELADSQVFPKQTNATTLMDPDQRWKEMKTQAGSHQQDGSVLRLRPGIHTPEVLRCGMPPQAASRVQELHVHVTGDSLPAWMDSIARTFENLQHLYVTQIQDEAKERESEVRESVKRTSLTQDSADEDTDAEKDRYATKKEEEDEEAKRAAEHSNRLKRLYILYRLPDLLTIDGVRVSTAERRLARPDSPNGERVKRKEWVTDSHENDIRISLEDSAVELDVLIQDPATPMATFTIEECMSTVTYCETVVEVDLVGKISTSDFKYDVKTPRDQAATSPREAPPEDQKNDALETSCVSPTAFQCGQLVLHENASTVTDDCEWSATCGGLAMWRNASTVKTLSAEAAQRAKHNFRQSSSWKECQRLAAARLAALPTPTITQSKVAGATFSRFSPTPCIEALPVEPGDVYKSTARESRITKGSTSQIIPNGSTPSKVNSPVKKVHPVNERLGSIVFSDDDNDDDEMISRNETPRSSKKGSPRKSLVHPRFQRKNSSPRKSSKKTASKKQQPEQAPQQPKSPKLKRRLSANRSLSSPFPMQFRDMSSARSSSNVSLEVITSTGEDGSKAKDPAPAPIPPPPPTSSRTKPKRSASPSNSSSNTEATSGSEPIEFLFPSTSPSLASSLSSAYSRTSSAPAAVTTSDLDKNALPPPCPPGNPPRRRMKNRQKRKKKRQGLLDKWKEQQSARSMSSIIDGEDEDGEDRCAETASLDSDLIEEVPRPE